MLMVFVMLVAVMPMNVFAANPPGGTVETGKSDETGKTGDGKDAGTDEEGTPATEEDKKAAKATVNALENISKDDKETALKAIGEATTKEAINELVADATARDNEAKELKKAKEDALAELTKLTHLTNEQRDAAKKAIGDAAKKEDVTTALDEAKAKEEEEKKKAEEKKEELAKAKTDAKDAVDKLANLSKEEKDGFKDAIDKANDKAGVNTALEAAKAKANQPTQKTGAYTISTGYTPYGDIEVNKSTADAEEQVTVTVKPKYGYVVSRVYYRVNGTSVDQTINNYYNSYYYDRYPGYYYGDSYYDYFSYYSEYRNSKYYYNHYSNYHEFLRYEHRSHYLNYKNWDDRYDDDDYYNWYYYKRNGYRPWYYGRIYDNSFYNTSDKFSMPQANITVYVEFTDWSYYGYDYDDYYYYRYYRNKKDNYYERQKKADEKAKEEKPAEEKPAKVYQESATITIGSNVFEQVNKNVLTKHEMDVTAYINNGRVMLPLRYVAEALGLQVTWIAETKTVVIWDLAQRVEIPIKTKNIIVNGVTYTSDVKPEIKSGRTMLPIANVARALGLIDGSDIVWDPIMKQVRVTRTITSK